MSDLPSQAVQDYLKAIHGRGGADRVVSPNDIATDLGVKAPSVTGMLKRLGDAGWIEYTPGAGAKLTSAGVTEARRVIRRHRLVELFLARVLGLDWSEVDAEAEALNREEPVDLEGFDSFGNPVGDPEAAGSPTSGYTAA